jgi:hypothetical protein
LRLARFRTWHRNEELPRTARDDERGDKLAGGLTQQELLWAWDSVRRYGDLAARAGTGGGSVTLTPAQFER